MKTIIKSIATIVFLQLFLITLVSAQVVKPVDRKKAVEQRNNAQENVLKRTNKAIAYAYEQVKKNKVYTGDLAKAVKHQQIAKQLAANNDSFRAIHHSRVARNYAYKAIRFNKGTINEEWNFTDEEQQLFGQGIPDNELNDDLVKKYPNDQFLDEKVELKELN